MSLSAAETQLQELGIEDPADIDIEAIAFYLGATIKYKGSHGCEASIVGLGDRAIIRVDPASSPERRRFSAAHECGHWTYHKGQNFRCRSAEIGDPNRDVADPERMADEYAADLLMPRYLFEPAAKSYSEAQFSVVEDLKTKFKMSFLATALRLVKYGPEPSILIYHNARGRGWFHSSEKIARWWFPKNQLDAKSGAFEILKGSRASAAKRIKMPGNTWFDFKYSERYELSEESVPYGDGTLTFITCSRF